MWNPIPVDPPAGPHNLKFKDIDPDEAHAIRQRGVLSFHAVGCTGHFQEHLPGSLVAKAMAAQLSNPPAIAGNRAAVGASFLFHLGDLLYKDEDPSDLDGKDQAMMYNSQFYAQYAGYGRQIFAIAGNHDAKTSVHKKKSAILHFLQNFCASERGKSPDNQTANSKRLTMIQPYPYWLFETAVCYVVGLFTNDLNGGQLDDPLGTTAPQYRWLVETLKSIKAAANGKVVFLALHYPPYSGAANFEERGDPNLGPTPRRPPPGRSFAPTRQHLAAGISRKRPVSGCCSVGSRTFLSADCLYLCRRMADPLPGSGLRRPSSDREDLQDMFGRERDAPKCALRCHSSARAGPAKRRLGEGGSLQRR